jgi:hypothetical protein
VWFPQKVHQDTPQTSIFASIVICVSEAQNIDTLFFMIGWAQCGFYKKRTGTRDTKLLFLHPVDSAGDVVHSGASWP